MRYSTLDGLRGVGALFVVVLHFAPDFGMPAPAHGYLAVDLFFCLSGFVLTRGYAGKITAGMDFREWLSIRLIRLYPLFFLSIALGVLASAIPGMPGGRELGSAIPAAVLTSLAMLPSPTWALMPAMFPLNAVAWSLFVEMLLSILFFWSSQWRTRTLWALLAVGLAGLILVRLSSGYIGGGFAWRDAPSGMVRGLFGFTAGMLIGRQSFERRVTPFAWISVAASAALLSLNPPHGSAYDLAAIIVAIPLLVMLSVRIEPSRPLAFRLAGDLSYAVYALHSVTFFALVTVTGHHSPLAGLLVLCSFLGLCWLLDRYYDCPVRRSLTAYRGHIPRLACEPSAR